MGYKLVERLRRSSAWQDRTEAAARIEALEAALREAQEALLMARRALSNMLEDGDETDRKQAMDAWNELCRLTAVLEPRSQADPAQS
jgi:hypothetical protein